MTAEANPKEPTETIALFVRGGREVRQYTDVETNAVRFEGFKVFERGIVHRESGEVVDVERYPRDFPIEATSPMEAVDRYDDAVVELREELKKEMGDEQPKIVKAPAGAEKLIQFPGDDS